MYTLISQRAICRVLTGHRPLTLTTPISLSVTDCQQQRHHSQTVIPRQAFHCSKRTQKIMQALRMHSSICLNWNPKQILMIQTLKMPLQMQQIQVLCQLMQQLSAQFRQQVTELQQSRVWSPSRLITIHSHSAQATDTSSLRHRQVLQRLCPVHLLSITKRITPLRLKKSLKSKMTSMNTVLNTAMSVSLTPQALISPRRVMTINYWAVRHSICGMRIRLSRRFLRLTIRSLYRHGQLQRRWKTIWLFRIPQRYREMQLRWIMNMNTRTYLYRVQPIRSGYFREVTMTISTSGTTMKALFTMVTTSGIKMPRADSQQKGQREDG